MEYYIQNMSLEVFKEIIKNTEYIPFYLNFSFWNLAVLSLTLFFLIWYTYETHKLAIQAQDSNLRPVVLRSGFIENWDKLSYNLKDNVITEDTKLLEFTIFKNIATSINGYIVKKGFKYPLLLGNDIAKMKDNQVMFSKKFGWMKPDTRIFAIFRPEDGKACEESDKIVIKYKDIEGNSYYTIHDENFNQESFKGSYK